MPYRTVYGDDGGIYINHDGVVHETKKGSKDDGAVLFSIKGENKWIPKSQISDYNNEIVAVKKWWAEKNGLKSDW